MRQWNFNLTLFVIYFFILLLQHNHFLCGIKSLWNSPEKVGRMLECKTLLQLYRCFLMNYALITSWIIIIFWPRLTTKIVIPKWFHPLWTHKSFRVVNLIPDPFLWKIWSLWNDLFLCLIMLLTCCQIIRETFFQVGPGWMFLESLPQIKMSRRK